MSTPSTDWGLAACLGADPGLFDETTSDTTAPPARAQQAAQWCAVCPIRVECLARAVENGDAGVWGGVWRHRRGGNAFGALHSERIVPSGRRPRAPRPSERVASRSAAGAA